ncbi:MAG: hypothetical protein CL871_04595 [Cytophagia bacterium]|nr:hypothetical protein [Cytophagia bacterium]
MRYLAFYLLFFFSSIANSQLINISSEVDTSIANIGDIITWKIIANNSDQKNVIFPDLNVKGDSISIRSQRSIFTDKGEVGRIIEITFWDTGRFHTPEYQISVLNKEREVKYKIGVEKLSLDIVSVIAPSMNAVPRPVKQPVPVKGILPYREFFFIILMAIIVLAIFWVWKKRLKNIYKKPVHLANKNPIDIARNRLSNLNEKGFAKEFYTELSHITREFVECSTYIRTLEMTTEEIIQNKELFLFDLESFNDWTTILSKADMVKYAKQSVDYSEMLLDKDKVSQFIDNFSN